MLRQIFRKHVDFDCRMGFWHICVNRIGLPRKQDTCLYNISTTPESNIDLPTNSWKTEEPKTYCSFILLMREVQCAYWLASICILQ